jgi:malonyl CoA-acyl carrier protein transacylase
MGHAMRLRDQIMRSCDVARASDLGVGAFAALKADDDAIVADGMFALAMAAAVLAAEAAPRDRAPLATAIGLLILECLPHAVERLSVLRVVR